MAKLTANRYRSQPAKDGKAHFRVELTYGSESTQVIHVRASKEDIRRYQLHLALNGASTPKINATVSALRFFFDVT